VLVIILAQREAVEALILELPKFRLKAVPTDCSECPICLEEFYVGNEVCFFLIKDLKQVMPCATCPSITEKCSPHLTS